MKFFIRYLLRIETTHTSAALITGSAFHEAKAVWYNTHSESKALRKLRKEIEDRENEYEYIEQFEKDLARFPILFEMWLQKYGEYDFNMYELVAVEKEIQVPIPGTDGFVMTMRPDLVYRDPEGRLMLMDTKTSSFSKAITDMGLYYGDQATAYLWAVEEEYNEKPCALRGDVAYWNKSSANESNISCYRTDLVIRSEEQIAEFRDQSCALFTEISQKVEAWKSGQFGKAQLFHRNTFYCNAYNRKCEYVDLCRTPIETKKRVPPGFRRVPRSNNKTLASFSDDMITVS